MRSLNDGKFATVWGRVLTATNPGLGNDRWSVDGVVWTRSRHSYRNERYALVIQVYDVRSPPDRKDAWAIMVIIENWWRSGGDKSIRSYQWGRVEKGRLKDVLRWFENQAELSEKR